MNTVAISKETTVKIQWGALVAVIVVLCIGWSTWQSTQEQVARNTTDITEAEVERRKLQESAILHTAYFEAIMTTITLLRDDLKNIEDKSDG